MNSPEKSENLSTANFYRNLRGFNDFTDLNDESYYSEVPKDWFVIISDIKGSTKAIEEGRYKEVNTLGAATISVLQKALGTFHFPFVFGGDGATALVHESEVEKAKLALLGLQTLAQNQFRMELRVGVISATEVYAAKKKILLAKFFMNPKKSIAMLRGGGLSWADEKIKAEPQKYSIDSSSQSLEELSGLSCRWQPIRSTRGQVATLLVMPTGKHHTVILHKVMDGLSSIFGNDLGKICPIKNNSLRYKSVIRCILDEWKFNSSHLGKSFFYRLGTIFVCVWAFRWKLPTQFFDRGQYEKSLEAHSDYRKFDDILRMVMDCTNQEILAVQDFLESLHSQGEICYGIHLSQESLMTCLVENMQQGGHIHFIDGGDGGYAMAAKGLKIQLKKFRDSRLEEKLSAIG